MNRLIKGLMTLAVVGAMATPASAQTALTSAWYSFSFGAPGTSVAETFMVTGTSGLELQIIDCCIIGDRFEAFADGVSLGETNPVGGTWGDSASDFLPDDLWAAAEVSRGQFTVQSGDVITLAVTADSWGPGGAYIRTVTPEPGTIILMATGLLGLGVAMRRRNDEDEV